MGARVQEKMNKESFRLFVHFFGAAAQSVAFGSVLLRSRYFGISVFRCFGCLRLGVPESLRDRLTVLPFYRNTGPLIHRNTETPATDREGVQKQKDSCRLIMVPSCRPTIRACSFSFSAWSVEM